MKKLELVKTLLLLNFLLVSVVYMRLAKSTPVWDCVFYTNIYGTLLAHFLLDFKKAWNSFEKVVYLGGCLFLLILLGFNIAIASKTKLEHDLLVTSFTWSNRIIWSVLGIFILLWIFKRFVK